MSKIIIRKNGPYLVEGSDVTVTEGSGTEVEISQRPFALCRCGASATKPFCDGSHSGVSFKD